MLHQQGGHTPSSPHSQHQQQIGDSPTPHHKSFVCEICGKAFRFRSNLAEHRSVHTAVKPFVCKFCGKSSRLKGNLTKHILKHHRTEQRDYIGTDDYIIKKGKKSVKDPAAIEFLEKSMIVLNNSLGAATGGQQSQSNGGGEQQNGGSEIDMADESQGILLSLGLDAGSLDLKAEPTGEEEEGALAELIAQQNHNERLLEHCESAIGGGGGGMDEGGPEEEEREEQQQPAEDSSSGGQRSAASSSPLLVGAGANALAAAACKALFGQMEGGRALANALFSGEDDRRQQIGQQPTAEQATSAGFESSGSNEPSALLGALAEEREQCQPTAGLSRLAATQCQQCGKHFRKPRDLIAHLATAHNALPSQNNGLVSPSSPVQLPSEAQNHQQQLGGRQKAGAAANGEEWLAQELRQLRSAMGELSRGTATLGCPPAAGGGGGTARVEQLLGQLDSRVCRLEKQLEMALNSIYTLVQLQTGINNSVNKLSRHLLSNQ